jgi:hypothetical protein
MKKVINTGKIEFHLNVSGLGAITPLQLSSSFENFEINSPYRLNTHCLINTKNLELKHASIHQKLAITK